MSMGRQSTAPQSLFCPLLSVWPSVDYLPFTGLGALICKIREAVPAASQDWHQDQMRKIQVKIRSLPGTPEYYLII